MVPTRADAAALLRAFEPPQWLLDHSSATAEVAAFICQRASSRGASIHAALVEAAALLHDVDKLLPPDHPLRALGHGPAGAAWMRENGYPELADAIAHHPVTTLGDAPSYDDWARGAGLEGRVVAYADKRARQDLVTLDERFAEWDQRFPGSAMLVVARERAVALEDEVCALAGVAPHEIHRSPWVSEALAGAG